MIKTLENLCQLNAPSGCERDVREYILDALKGYADCKTDALGNIIAFKKGKNRPQNKLMIDAHMDEVGIIITSVTEEGFLKFTTLGGIKDCILLSRTVTLENGVSGIIGCKPVHLSTADERKKAPKADELYIDIGVASKEEAEKYINVGDSGVIDSDFEIMGDNVKAKAIDDRAGCLVLLELLKQDSEYDFYATFTVQEEIGTRGARVATYNVDPDFALALEATTAADIDGVGSADKVCVLGRGPAVSFMDRSTVYDRELYDIALNSGITCQPKASVTGGNNSSAIHLSREGVRTLALSVPCRYIHSPSCVANVKDIENTISLTKYMINKICSGEIK
ncbi:MAG: M42 family metallopeptidase [Ruminococcaceae bacterium]|nr:M42 family metallopeptidase [Oscillospiraceae bacterium]